MNDSKSEALPLVVQLGFAGSRQLLDPEATSGIYLVNFEKEIADWLTQRLRQLRLDLRLEDRHFFCGISAMAAGGDTMFAKACQGNRICQRIFLPQTRDEFLNASGSKGPDFSESQKAEAILLLDNENVIQERLVSDSRIREERFEDVNREIVRVSDVLICMVRENGDGKPGGTEDLIARAAHRCKPVLVIHVGAAKGKPTFAERWFLPEKRGVTPSTIAEAFEPPKPPQTLQGEQMSHADEKGTLIARYAAQVKGVSSRISSQMRSKFLKMAIIIVGTHIVATILATIALAFMTFIPNIILIFLLAELAMLIMGFKVHSRLHETRVAHQWAEARLLAEVARSVIAVGNLHLYLEHLFALPFPRAIKPLLRTINVLQLQCTSRDRQPWESKRDRYVEMRLTMPENGQIDFYGRKATGSKKWLELWHNLFKIFWAIAVTCTSLKLVLELLEKYPECENFLAAILISPAFVISVLGAFAIVMPVLAAAALSLAAALDLEAQQHTYHEMFEFLEEQKKYFKNATSERDYAKLVLETESLVLGETANWFSRRSFTSVA